MSNVNFSMFMVDTLGTLLSFLDIPTFLQIIFAEKNVNFVEHIGQLL